MALVPLVALLAVAPAVPTGPQDTSPAPAARGWDDFPVLVWRQEHAGEPLPEPLAEAFGGTILMRGEDSAPLRARGLAYLVWNVAGRDALHLDADEAWRGRVERWVETRDEALLVREPCLSDPAVVAELFATLDASLARHGDHPGLGLVLGDEVSLTPNGDPFDLCRSEHCEAAWRAWAGGRDLPERSPSTDEVRLALGEGDHSGLGAWLARRRFDQLRLLGLLERLADRARGDEHRRVALLGLKGRTAFGGVDVFGAARLADVLECYPVGDALPSLLASRSIEQPYRSFLGGRVAGHDSSLATLFLTDESPDGAAWLAWEAWLRGADGLVLWSDADLDRSPAVRERLAGAVAAIRSVHDRYEVQWPRSGDVALVHDGDSVAASWLRAALLDGPTWPRRTQAGTEAEGARERSLRAWRALADDCGVTLRAVPLEDPGRLCRVLVLPHLLVLDPSDVERLGEHLERGGTLVVDGELGWVDRAGARWEEDVFQLLARRAPERVLRAPPGLADYPALRSLGSGDRHRGFLRGLVPPVPVVLRAREHEPVAWLRAVRGGPGPTRIVAFLPSAVTPAERARLRPLDLEVAADAEVTWLHPARGEPLPAGDAAVLLVR